VAPIFWVIKDYGICRNYLKTIGKRDLSQKVELLEIVQEVEENNFRLSEGLKELIYSF